jgi:hypothetical protein
MFYESLLHKYRCPRVAKKLHNLFVIKDINFYFLLDESYASTAHSENIAVYTGGPTLTIFAITRLIIVQKF